MRRVRFAVVLLLCLGPAATASAADIHFGFSRADITPSEPLRLSGYGNREKPSEGVDEPLFARVMALRCGDGPVHVLVSVDTIGFPGTLTRQIQEQVEQRHGVSRARLALACTHSHTSPHIKLEADNAFADNLFAVPQTDDEREKTIAYTSRTRDRIVAAVGDAISDLSPGRLFAAEGKATFAKNRRVIRDSKWTGFGEAPAGPVDHALPLLKITDASGQTLRGLVFNYACHCTTFGGEYNRVNGDWAGYAARSLEEAHAAAVALCTIGCGADANPQRDRDKAFQLAQSQGREIADEVQRLLAGDMTEITAPLHATYGFAGLPIDRPSLDELRGRLSDGNPQVRRHAENMLAVHERMGRLPETYPMPIQVWRFGDQFAMVFLGGEVCVDYSFRIKKELREQLSALSSQLSAPVWVTSYANDVFGYVASERMRAEGGYEVDSSMIYYNQPGRWSSGTEEVILRRLHELFRDGLPEGPISAEDSLRYFTLPEGFAIDLVAAEPLITDPVNFAGGPDGRLWVVEMGDYPRGANGEAPAHGRNTPWDGPAGGRIQVLTDRDHDGRYDEAVTFIDDLHFPTGVFPWRKGAIVACAPDILYLEDTNGDGRADERKVLFTGFVESNPQHRVNGFAYGLDNWLYLGSGASSGEITCVRTGETVNISNRDLRIDPDRGLLEAESGRTQYGRSRDDWGNWFGNTNSEPLFHFVISDRHLRRNPFVASPKPTVHLVPGAVEVFPTSRTLDRFNDLYALNRFTSACSPTIFRDSTLGPDVQGAALICEPVHNLVSRRMLQPDSVTFRADRHGSEQQSEFLSSRDNWFRPVRLATGPDGTLWVCDMYRMVIEHPQWIPEAWQARINVYAGNDRGRIYRIYRTEQPPTPVPDLRLVSENELVAQLRSDNGWRRDTAQMLLVQRELVSPDALRQLEDEAARASSPLTRIHALNVLGGRDALTERILLTALRDPSAAVVREAARLCEDRAAQMPALAQALRRIAAHDDVHVRYQIALALGAFAGDDADAALADIAARDIDDAWVRAAVLTSVNGRAERVLVSLLRTAPSSDERSQLVGQLVATALGDAPEQGVARILRTIAAPQGNGVQDWQLLGLAACVDALERRKLDLARLGDSGNAELKPALAATEPLFAHARETVRNPQTPLDRRCSAAALLARGLSRQDEDRRLLVSLLGPQTPPNLQSAAVASLSRLRGEAVPGLLMSNWRSTEPRLRSEILSALLSRDAWAKVLVARLAEGEIAVADLDAATRNRLSEHKHDDIRAAAATLLGAATSADRRKVLDDYRSAVEQAGDASRGAEVFRKRCAACHQHQNIGADVGAKLASLQDKSADSLLTAILDPNRAVEAKYTGYSAATRDGRVVTGMIVEETATSITLAKSDGTRDIILRVDLDSLASSGKSFMPEGLEKDLSPQDVADVIAFVRSE